MLLFPPSHIRSHPLISSHTLSHVFLCPLTSSHLNPSPLTLSRALSHPLTQPLIFSHILSYHTPLLPLTSSHTLSPPPLTSSHLLSYPLLSPPLTSSHILVVTILISLSFMSSTEHRLNMLERTQPPEPRCYPEDVSGRVVFTILNTGLSHHAILSASCFIKSRTDEAL